MSSRGSTASNRTSSAAGVRGQRNYARAEQLSRATKLSFQDIARLRDQAYTDYLSGHVSYDAKSGTYRVRQPGTSDNAKGRVPEWNDLVKQAVPPDRHYAYEEGARTGGLRTLAEAWARSDPRNVARAEKARNDWQQAHEPHRSANPDRYVQERERWAAGHAGPPALSRTPANETLDQKESRTSGDEHIYRYFMDHGPGRYATGPKATAYRAKMTELERTAADAHREAWRAQKQRDQQEAEQRAKMTPEERQAEHIARQHQNAKLLSAEIRQNFAQGKASPIWKALDAGHTVTLSRYDKNNGAYGTMKRYTYKVIGRNGDGVTVEYRGVGARKDSAVRQTMRTDLFQHDIAHHNWTMIKDVAPKEPKEPKAPKAPSSAGTRATRSKKTQSA